MSVKSVLTFCLVWKPVTNRKVSYNFLDKFILIPTSVNLAHNLRRAEITFNDELNCHFLLLLFPSEKISLSVHLPVLKTVLLNIPTKKGLHLTSCMFICNEMMKTKCFHKLFTSHIIKTSLLAKGGYLLSSTRNL